MTEKQLEQLNVKIAKKLGWKKFKKDKLPYPMTNQKRTIGIAPGNFRYQFVPNYFGNLAYAMKCVDWASEHDYNFKLIKYGKYVGETRYFATFEYNGRETFKDGILPSVAICMAFLKIK